MDDLISRQAAIELIAKREAYDAERETGEDFTKEDFLDWAENFLSSLPSAEQRGMWIYPTDIIGFGRCGNCKALWDIGLIRNKFFRYCPRCGARMGERRTDE